MLTEKQQREAAKQFAQAWAGKGFEKGESQPFWLALLRDVFGIQRPEEYIKFEEQVHLDHTSFIDGHIPATKVLIEQKSLGKDLSAPSKQSDGSLLTPFQQAKRYVTELPVSQHPRWVVTCNFSTFHVYDMEHPQEEPEVIELKNLPKEFYRLQFLVDGQDAHLKKELEISVKAGDIVGQLYDELLKQYVNPKDPKTLKSLNILCVRLVFCLYAEDAGLFGKKSAFHDYLAQTDAQHLRTALIALFRVLDTKEDEREPYLTADLAAFPYVNGGLFAEENIEIPMFTEEIRELLLTKASADFDWADISPTIFGAVFESTLNPETRRKGGMHYTSVENIHKVIDPLFLDDLREELATVLRSKQKRTQNLREFQNKLASLTFLDPACGSGNFLTETYLSLRRLENKVLRELQQGHRDMGAIFNPVKVSIGQFYGIEINDFAVSVAKTALWIAEAQMLKETEDIVGMDLDFFPLKSYANIVEGNALRMDWSSVIPKEKLSYIMGNPPFVGAKLTTPEQRQDKCLVFNSDEYGKLDYVGCWYKKAADFMIQTAIQCAFVSTNSIAQGEQVDLLWEPLFRNGIVFNFAHTTFRWDSEANLKAHVHCVIIGFSYVQRKSKSIFTINSCHKVMHINAYLMPDTPDVFLSKRQKPLCDVPNMTKGSQLIDGGHFVFTEQEKDSFLESYPETAPYFYGYLNADSFLNHREPTFCLCLKGCSPTLLHSCKGLREIIQKVYDYRTHSDAISTKKLADRPSEFFITNIPSGNSILIPIVSSERRKYIPLGFISDKMIYTNASNYIDNANLYHFGILTSQVHNAWMRAVAGRLKSDYRYSKDIVYNNFPWPTPTEQQKARIEQTAQAILDARALYPNSSLADLYDDLTMPIELRKAHQENDKAVLEAYGLPKNTSESDIVARLFKLYQKLTENAK